MVVAVLRAVCEVIIFHLGMYSTTSTPFRYGL